MKYYAIIDGERIEVIPKQVPVEETGVGYTVYTDRYGNLLPNVKIAKEYADEE